MNNTNTNRVVTYAHAYVSGQTDLCETCVENEVILRRFPVLGPVQHGLHVGECAGCLSTGNPVERYWQIHARATGVYLGIFPGESEDDALDALAREAEAGEERDDSALGIEEIRIFRGRTTRQVDGVTCERAKPGAWYFEPVTYDGDVLWSHASPSREALISSFAGRIHRAD